VEENFVAGNTVRADWSDVLRSTFRDCAFAHTCGMCAVLMNGRGYTEAMNHSFFQHQCACALGVWVCRPCFSTLYQQRSIYGLNVEVIDVGVLRFESQ